MATDECLFCEEEYQLDEKECDNCVFCPACVESSVLSISGREGLYWLFSFSCSLCHERECVICITNKTEEIWRLLTKEDRETPTEARERIAIYTGYICADCSD